VGPRLAYDELIKRAGHDPRWREFLQDPWLDYDAIRARLG